MEEILREEMGKGKLHINLGKRIVQLRTKQGVRQVDLALKAEMDDAFLRKIETGRINPTLSTLEKVAKGLNVKMKDLFDFE